MHPTEEPSPGPRVEPDHYRPCILSGDIRATGALCDIISFLAHASWWGELVVENGATMRSLYFDTGHVVAATSTEESERLGEVLVRCEAITRGQLNESLAHSRTRGLRLGEALVELGFLQREELFGLMGKQVEEIFAGITAIDGGRFVFFEGFDDADLSFRQRHSVDGLLLDAIRRMDEKKHFAARIPSDAHVPVRSLNVPPPSDDPFGVFAAIDGTRSVAQLAAGLGIGELDVTRVLFQHVHTGHASIRPPRLNVPATIEVYNHAIVMLLRELDAMDQGDQVREQLATFASGATTAALFGEIVPAEDGSLDIADTVQKIARSSQPKLAEERLAEWLYDYSSYALFLARPYLDRAENARSQGASRVSTRVRELLAPIAATEEVGAPMAPPPSLGTEEMPPVAALERVTVAPRTTVPIKANVEPTKSGEEASPPSASTLRIRKSFAVPGLDPTRTTRLARASVEPATGAAHTSRLQAYARRAPLQHPAFVLPSTASPSAATPVAPPVAGPVEAPIAPPPLRRGVTVAAVAAVVALVAASALATGLLIGRRERPSDDAARITNGKSAGRGRTELVVVCDPACGQVYVDGKQIDSPLEPVAVAAGPHDVIVTHAGFAQQLRRVDVSQGQSQAVSFKLAPTPH